MCSAHHCDPTRLQSLSFIIFADLYSVSVDVGTEVFTLARLVGHAGGEDYVYPRVTICP